MKHLFTNSLFPVLAGSGGFFVLAGLLHTIPANADAIGWNDYNRETVEQDILPAYQRLAEKASTLATATSELCRSTDETHLDSVHSAFSSTLYAWQGVSAIQFGPIQFLMRNYAIQYWPDRKSIGRRQLQSVLEMPADTRFDETFFHQASVSIKGLPALERLLYNDDALSQLQGPGLNCRLASAIANNVAEMTQSVANDWQQGYEAMLTVTPDDDEESGPVPELSINLMKSLVEPVEMIRDTKLRAVMSRGPDATYPHRAESWMSEQSLANIRANLQAAHRLYTGESAGLDLMLKQQGHAELAEEIEQRFRQIEASLEPLGDSLVAALGREYSSLLELTAQFKSLDESLNQAMQALDVQLGFNSRDGD
ncbi:imelysin family protein [Marinobacterium litorale]|uniref:imelysin family protein n=1 Tax=Marinobacterium litorale TaxID=404770 RepID=UPI0004156D8E|nr:imelysin family protein [Marinobacterium litorale]